MGPRATFREDDFTGAIRAVGGVHLLGLEVNWSGRFNEPWKQWDPSVVPADLHGWLTRVGINTAALGLPRPVT